MIDLSESFSPLQAKVMSGLCSAGSEQIDEAEPQSLLAEVEEYWADRWIVLSGPVRSGKTHVAVMAFMLWAFQYFEEQNFLVAARQFRLIKSNLKPHMERACQVLDLACRWNTADSALEVESNKFWCVDGSNSESAAKIQGITAAGAFLDEGTLMPEEFVMAVGERCSEPGAKIVITCNPREPTHWLHQKYIQRGALVRCKHVQFGLPDNPTLDVEYIRNLAVTHTGTWLRRNVLGEWAAGEGLIWPLYTVTDSPGGPPDNWYVVVDAADRTTTHALLAGRWGPRIHISAEWYHNAHINGEIPVDQKVEAYMAYFEGLTDGSAISWYVCDRHAYAELAVLRARARAPVFEGPNVPGSREASIDQAYIWLQTEDCTIDRSVGWLLKSINGFTYESQRRAKRNETKTDHGADALRMLLFDLANKNIAAPAGVVEMKQEGLF